MTEFKRQRCRCGGPLYDTCCNCLEEMCGDCIMRRTCRESESGRHLGGRPDLHYMTFERFTNALRILCNIDRDEFEEAHGYTDDSLLGSNKTMDWHWNDFRDNPWRWLITADDQGAKGVFALVQRRLRSVNQARQ